MSFTWTGSKSFLIVLTVGLLMQAQATMANMEVEQGAQLFIDRCALCHGNLGMGDGLMVLLQSDYPETGLIQAKFGKEKEEVIDAVRWGGAKGRMSALSPPWNYELSEQEILSVADFVLFLREHTEDAVALLKDKVKSREPSSLEGKRIFLGRCAICHGRGADGQGRLAGRVIKNPPPANLKLSVADEASIKEIVELGGAGVARSPQMPPWKEELLLTEIDSVVMYLMSLRAGKEVVK